MFKVTESRITTLAAEWWRLVQAGNTLRLSNREAEWFFDAADAIVARLALLRATDASEIAAKVLICAYEYRNGEPLPGTDVYALMSSTTADAIRLADPSLELLAENVICDLDATDAPNRLETRRCSASATLH